MSFEFCSRVVVDVVTHKTSVSCDILLLNLFYNKLVSDMLEHIA